MCHELILPLSSYLPPTPKKPTKKQKQNKNKTKRVEYDKHAENSFVEEVSCGIFHFIVNLSDI